MKRIKQLVINSAGPAGKAALSLVIVFSLGLSLGMAFAQYTLRSALFEGGRFPFLLYRPTIELYSVYASLNDPDPAKRLGGYYALKDYSILDEKFVRERYDLEESEVIRRTLVWLLSFSENRDLVLKQYDQLYPAASPGIRKQILSDLVHIYPAASPDIRERILSDLVRVYPAASPDIRKQVLSSLVRIYPAASPGSRKQIMSGLKRLGEGATRDFLSRRKKEQEAEQIPPSLL